MAWGWHWRTDVQNLLVIVGMLQTRPPVYTTVSCLECLLSLVAWQGHTRSYHTRFYVIEPSKKPSGDDLGDTTICKQTHMTSVVFPFLSLNRPVSTGFQSFPSQRCQASWNPLQAPEWAFSDSSGTKTDSSAAWGVASLYLLISLLTLWFCRWFAEDDKSLIQQVVDCCWLLSLIFIIHW